MRKKKFLSLLLFFVASLKRGNCYMRNNVVSGTKSQIFLGSCIIGAYCVANCVKVISTGDQCTVERLGKFHRKMNPGINFMIPFLETISFKDTLREQVLDVPPQECFTLDNAPITADAIVYMRIVEMRDACYKVANVRNAVLNLCLTNVREEIGRLTLEESFSSRGSLNKVLVTKLNRVCKDWGVEITRIEIQHLEPSPEILRSMELQMSAERKKRAAILQSEGEKMKLINEAEGRAGALIADAEARKKSIVLGSQAEAERQEIEAEGIKLAIEKISEAISSNGQASQNDVRDALQLLTFVRYMETQGKFAESGGTKVLMFPTKDTLPLTYEGLNSLVGKEPI